MLECLIIGDSIAHGIAMQRPECVDYSHVGWTSKQSNTRYRTSNLNAETVIISLGTNDSKYVDTYKELSQLRELIHAKKVIWILPAAVNPKNGTNIGLVQASIESIAGAHKDHILSIPHPMADHYHPTGKGYKKLAKETK